MTQLSSISHLVQATIRAWSSWWEDLGRPHRHSVAWFQPRLDANLKVAPTTINHPRPAEELWANADVAIAVCMAYAQLGLPKMVVVRAVDHGRFGLPPIQLFKPAVVLHVVVGSPGGDW